MRSGKLRILHCIRAPLGGAFRHLVDLVESQSAMGHEVGVVYASNALPESAKRTFSDISDHLKLGCISVPMARSLSPRDALSFAHLIKAIAPLHIDVLHGHGAKGGVWARTVGTALRFKSQKPQRIYSPHGGSLHYDRSSMAGKIYIGLEKALSPLTDACVFTSEFEQQAYDSKVGLSGKTMRFAIVHNGLRPHEFAASPLNESASDFLFVGELRKLKGVDVLIEALAGLHRTTESKPTLAIVGEGPDKDTFQAMVAQHSLQEYVQFHGYKPLIEALPLSKIAVIPSRAEALPYIVLELIAAEKPLLTTKVGGIPEIFADQRKRLLEPGNVQALQTAMAHALAHDNEVERQSRALQSHLKAEFTLSKMAQNITELYWPDEIPQPASPHSISTSARLPSSATKARKF